MIKAVFFDIDGTLVSFKTHKIPDSAADAINILKSKGIKVFIATGRPFICINNLGSLEFDGMVTLNGGYCIDGSGSVIRKCTIPQKDVSHVSDYMKSNPFPCAFVAEHDIFMNMIDENVLKMLDMLNFPKPKIDSPGNAGIYGDILQFVAFMDEKFEAGLMNGMSGSVTTRWNPIFTDIIPSGSNKAEGIKSMMKHYSIPEDGVMAFGDGGNDMEMLEFATIGVAMGNSEPKVKAAADYVTASVDEDGVRNALSHYGLI